LGQLIDASGSQLTIGVDKDDNISSSTTSSDELYSMMQSVPLSDTFVIVALDESKAAADRAVMRIQALWGDLVNLLSGAPRTDVYAHVEHITR